MTFDDAVYAFLLLVSLCLGPLMKPGGGRRRFLSAFFGFVMVTCTTGLNVWHSMATVFGFVFLLGSCSPRFIHYAACVWCFGYLGFFRTCHLFGFAPTSGIVNAVQLLLTLRIIGLAFELRDTWIRDQRLSEVNRTTSLPEYERLMLLKEHKSVNVSPLEVICYAYCYIGIFTGPYYKYRTFHDFVNWPISAPAASIDPLIQQLQEAPLFGVAYLILSHFYSVDYVRLKEFYEHGYGYRLLYMVIIFFIFRLRVYFAWKMAECVCVAAGLGAYPAVSESVCGEGPTNLKALSGWIADYSPVQKNSIHSEQAMQHANSISPVGNAPNHTTPMDSATKEVYSYNTIQNISVWGCEFTPTVREGMRSWNKSVQYWLATNFHKRCPGSRNIRHSWTMIVSAYWHGLYPGYYLSFLTIPLALMAESGLIVLINAFGQGLPSGSQSFFSWLLKMRVFEYCAMGFLLQDAGTTLNYWHCVGYCVHILLLGIIVLSALVQRLSPSSAAFAVQTRNSSTDKTGFQSL